MSGIEIEHWVRSGEALLQRSARTVVNADNATVRAMGDRLPAALAPDADERLKVVFAGQYSAGKSTIIRAMTGRVDVETGAKITTQEAREYDWNGIVVVDTPGVHTEVRPEHDTVAYRAISAADLLVFVVTNELFDSHLAAHFRELAVDRNKGGEMMLVVNKMGRSANGNTPEVREVIGDDLRKVVAPFTPEELRLSFVDAELAAEASEEPDGEMRGILEQESAFAAFLDAVNGFVRDKGLAGRYTTKLYVLEQVLQEALAAVPSEEPEVDALQQLATQERRALVESRERFSLDFDARIRETCSAIRDDGRGVADLVDGDADPELVNAELHNLRERTDQRSKQLAEGLAAITEEHAGRLTERMGLIAEGELAKSLHARLAVDFGTDAAGTSRTAGPGYRQAAEGAVRVGEFLARHSFNAQAGTRGLFALGQHSGTGAHWFVKEAGALLGKSFKPWEAVKWARIVGNAGRVLNVAGCVLNIVLQFKEDQDAARREEDLRESRTGIRHGADEAARAVQSHFDLQRRSLVSKTYDEACAEVDERISELRGLRKARGKLVEELTAHVEETRALIGKMHADHG